jgi:hypothetical protein
LFSGVIATVAIWPAVFSRRIDNPHLLDAALLLALSCVYPMFVRSLERMRHALTLGHGPNVQGVWVAAAALALPPSLIVAVGVTAYAAEWRYRRAIPEFVLHRYVYTAAASVLAAEIASELPGRGIVAAVPTLVAFDLINAGLVLAIARLTAPPEVFGARLKTMRAPRTLAMDAACLATALIAGIFHGSAWPTGAVAVLSIPALIAAQRWAVLHELASTETTDPASGLLTAAGWLRLVTLHSAWPLSILVFRPPNTSVSTLKLCGEVLTAALVDDTSLGVVGHHGDGIVAAVNLHAPLAMVVARLVEDGLQRNGVHVVVDVAVALDPEDVPSAISAALSERHPG